MIPRIETPFGSERGFLVKLSTDQHIKPFDAREFDAHAILVIGRGRLRLNTDYPFLYLARGDVMAVMPTSVGSHKRMDLLLNGPREILKGELQSAGQINIVFSRNSNQEPQILRVIQGQSGSLNQQLTARASDLYRRQIMEPVLGTHFLYRYATLIH